MNAENFLSNVTTLPFKGSSKIHDDISSELMICTDFSSGGLQSDLKSEKSAILGSHTD